MSHRERMKKDEMEQDTFTEKEGKKKWSMKR